LLRFSQVDVAAKGALQRLLAQVKIAIEARTAETGPLSMNSGKQSRLSYGRDPIDEQARTATKPPHSGSAKVNGRVACSGTRVDVSLDIDGDIDAKTVESVGKLFEEAHERSTRVSAGHLCEDATTVDYSLYGEYYQINSRGGNVASAMAIARILRKERANLQVRDGGVCISACVLVLARAVERVIPPATSIGIHRPYLATVPSPPAQRPTAAQIAKEYGAMLDNIRSYLREMNVSEQLGIDMLAISPESVRILSEAELKDYHLSGIDPGEQRRIAINNEAFEVSEANRLGIDRREYIRRKALGDSVCAAFGAAGHPADYLDCKKRVLETVNASLGPTDDPKATRATASEYAIRAADDVIARKMALSRVRFGFRKKIERSPPRGHVGLDLALRRVAACIGAAVHRVNECCGRSRRVGRHHAMAGIGIADVLERPRVIVRLQTATRDFRELE
jgi:hypothetical protein